MSKEWLLNSTALVVSLVVLLGGAKTASGITVHEVLSNGFFATEHQGTYDYVTSGTYTHHHKEKKSQISGNTHTYQLIKRGKWLPPEKIKWKYKASCSETEETDDAYFMYDKKTDSILKVSRPGLKEKMKEQISQSECLPYDDIGNTIGYMTVTSDYMNKHRRRQPQPLGPKVPDNNLTTLMGMNGDPDFMVVQFYGTQESAITNVISDHEAYITHSIAQTAFLERYASIPVNVTSSFLQVRDQHITTDGDRVYIHEIIKETSQDAPDTDRQHIYKTDYTATFKKGRCVQETEQCEEEEDDTVSKWLQEYLKSEGNSTGTTSIRNGLAPTGVRPGVAVDEHTQKMLDLLNQSNGVRVVVRSTQVPADSITVNSSGAGASKPPVGQSNDQQSGNNSAARTGPRVRVIRNQSFDRRKLNGGNEGI